MLSRPLIDRIAFFGISWYAILIVGAILIGYFLCCNEARRIHLPQDTILDFMLYAIPLGIICLLYTSPSPRDGLLSRMPSSA